MVPTRPCIWYFTLESINIVDKLCSDPSWIISINRLMKNHTIWRGLNGYAISTPKIGGACLNNVKGELVNMCRNMVHMEVTPKGSACGNLNMGVHNFEVLITCTWQWERTQVEFWERLMKCINVMRRESNHVKDKIAHEH